MTDAPGLMTRQQAAEYLGLTAAGFDVWVRKGIALPPGAGTRRWDRKAIDAALGKSSGLTSPEQTDESPFQKWERENPQETRHSAHRTDSGQYVRSIDLSEWTDASLKAPLGKRELQVISQIYEITSAGGTPQMEQIRGAGLTTISKLGARGLLEPDGPWFKMQLSKKGLAAYRSFAPENR